MNSPINPMNYMGQEYSQFCQNPIQYLAMRRINIPQQFQNDPRGAVQYLLNNGTMQQNAFNSFAQFCQSTGIKI